jgi:hypothetical protein
VCACVRGGGKKCVKWTHNSEGFLPSCTIRFDQVRHYGSSPAVSRRISFFLYLPNFTWNRILLFFLSIQEPEACNNMHRIRLNLATILYSLSSSLPLSLSLYHRNLIAVDRFHLESQQLWKLSNIFLSVWTIWQMSETPDFLCSWHILTFGCRWCSSSAVVFNMIPAVDVESQLVQLLLLYCCNGSCSPVLNVSKNLF